ncbi:cyclic nucleotide-binding/CBS domain-containing protein [Haloprofundus sp. MHR1]|uniref:CBS domain-containing protein n=1 Tax=Haloprofundus sp. MHR1 TaxID=2572921 RepID=UPI0010BEC675|nr:CBS domain-containing protein [Haloprofundus sp. MHR1]QCJ46491.1 CBS domain-containing protein [Haloprofundus sp. MHR1]
MNTDVTVRDAMEREFVGVSESDSVRAAAELMFEEDADCIVVLRGNEPVGVVPSRTALGVVLDDADDTSVSEVMVDPEPTVESETALVVAEDRMRSEATPWALVVDEGELVGLLTERDVLMAATLTQEEMRTEGQERTPANRPEFGDADGPPNAETNGGIDSETYSSQSICEVCGSLARTLSNVNGQLVCSDCRDV